MTKAAKLASDILNNPIITPIPSKDVIHPSEKDASSISKDVVVSSDSESLEIEEKGKDVQGSRENVLKTLIPLTPKPHWPNWGLDYLKSLLCTRTDGAAAIRIGITFQAVYEHRLKIADFERAVQACRKYRNVKIVSDIEDATLPRALKGDPKDRMSASLGMFHLKALDDIYKDKQAGHAPIININLGYQIPATKRHHGPITDAEYDE